ncbi:hypothetical protein AArc1_4044 (plasmid) [Natrarchaeobaculum sulfurireducens]|uniref:Uncharacterized protein n=1 Tax=Natrarchaeobaculum sulfurireducens TaxID=2044521 RepID=A0A346P9G6_9EURY|nr:hypothetical protein AArc1_4044 [Natrarchaeobaculum sulfurireducens]
MRLPLLGEPRRHKHRNRVRSAARSSRVKRAKASETRASRQARDSSATGAFSVYVSVLPCQYSLLHLQNQFARRGRVAAVQATEDKIG